jgi:uncharacterized Zn finger protein (UPF0148 family)
MTFDFSQSAAIIRPAHLAHILATGAVDITDDDDRRMGARVLLHDGIRIATLKCPHCRGRGWVDVRHHGPTRCGTCEDGVATFAYRPPKGQEIDR